MKTEPNNHEPPAPHPLEWVLVGIEAVLVALLIARQWHPGLMPGQLLPSVVLGLAPGCSWRLAGRPSLSAHRFGVAVGLVTFLFTNGILDFHRLGIVLSRWELVVPGVLLVASTAIPGSLRWRLLLKAQGIDLSRGEALRLTLVGHFFNTFVPGATGGDIFRAYYVAKGSGRTGAAIGSVILDRFMGLPPLLGLVLLGAVLNLPFLRNTESFRPYAWIITVAGIASVVLIGLFILFAFIMPSRASTWDPGFRGGAQIKRLILALAGLRSHLLSLAGVLALGLVAHTSILTACILFGQAAGVENIPPERYLLLAPLGMTINAIPAAPGGLGQGEAAFANIFAAASAIPANASAGALVMLCVRAGLVLCGLAGGVLYALGRHAIDDAREEAEHMDEARVATGDPA